MTEQPEEAPLMMGLHITWRQYGDEPSAIVNIPLGGSEPVILIGFNFDEDAIIGVRMDVTGVPDAVTLIDLLKSIAEHMETQESFVMSNDGVEYNEPLRKEQGT